MRTLAYQYHHDAAILVHPPLPGFLPEPANSETA